VILCLSLWKSARSSNFIRNKFDLIGFVGKKFSIDLIAELTKKTLNGESRLGFFCFEDDEGGSLAHESSGRSQKI
jgi:hypothetical protein